MTENVKMFKVGERLLEVRSQYKCVELMHNDNKWTVCAIFVF